MVIVKVLFVATATFLFSGCIQVSVHEADTPMPEPETTTSTLAQPPQLVASKLIVPARAYQGKMFDVHATLKHVGPPDTDGSLPVCLAVDGQVQNVTRDCAIVSLISGETTERTWGVVIDDSGAHSISVLNASHSVDVYPIPTIGDRVNGTYVDLQLSGQDGNWTVHAWPRDTSKRIDIMFELANGRPVPYAGQETSVQWQAKSRALDVPTGGMVKARITAWDGETGQFVDEGLFVWQRA